MAPDDERGSTGCGRQAAPSPEKGRPASASEGGRPRARPVEMRSVALERRVDTPIVARAMPPDFSISLAASGSADSAITRPGKERRQPMQGYEETFIDIIDFILRCTHRIWDEKAVGYLYEHYGSNTRVIDDAGMVYGRDQVIENTLGFIAAFPDLSIHADEIIWCGDEATGFWTSHRAVLLGHNTGWSSWGPPTGRKIIVTCIANCYSIENQITDEFVIYNTGSLLRQLGYDIRDKALELIGSDSRPRRVGEVERLLGQGPPPVVEGVGDGTFDLERFVRSSLHEIWNWRLLDRITTVYSAGIRFHGPTDLELYGRGQYGAYVLGMLAAFPDLGYEIDDLYWMGNEEAGYLAAVRWTIVGTHRGPGPFGKPSGVQVHMWGITHLQIRDAQIVEEWTVNNEFDVLCQILGSNEKISTPVRGAETL
jgi:predicted ester cyclase